MKLTKMPEPRLGGETTHVWIPTTAVFGAHQKEALTKLVDAWCVLGWWRGYAGGAIVNATNPRFDSDGVAWCFDGYSSITDKDEAVGILVRCLEEFGRRERIDWNEIVLLGDI